MSLILLPFPSSRRAMRRGRGGLGARAETARPAVQRRERRARPFATLGKARGSRLDASRARTVAVRKRGDPVTRTIAKTAQGDVRGRERGGPLLFAGIPYAAPPVGARRFRPPE